MDFLCNVTLSTGPCSAPTLSLTLTLTLSLCLFPASGPRLAGSSSCRPLLRHPCETSSKSFPLRGSLSLPATSPNAVLHPLLAPLFRPLQPYCRGLAPTSLLGLDIFLSRAASASAPTHGYFRSTKHISPTSPDPSTRLDPVFRLVRQCSPDKPAMDPNLLKHIEYFLEPNSQVWTYNAHFMILLLA